MAIISGLVSLVFVAGAVPASAEELPDDVTSPPPGLGGLIELLGTDALEQPQQVRSDGAVLVDVTAEPGQLDAVVELLASQGEIIAAIPDVSMVSAWLMPEPGTDIIATVEALPGVLDAVTPPAPSVGSVTGGAVTPRTTPDPACRTTPVEQDGPLLTALARADYGLDGSGVTVGVLSDSYAAAISPDTTPEQDVAAGALPGPGNPCGYLTPVEVLADLGPGLGADDEGRAMLQLVHGIAPGARLMFATGFPTSLVMAENIRALAAAGATVIVDDITFYSEPGFQSGIVSQAIAEVVASGVSYFSSAGNASLQGANENQIGSWGSDSFGVTPCPAVVDEVVSNTGCLDFSMDPSSPDPTNTLTVHRDPTGEFSVTLRVTWAEPWFGVETRLLLAVLRPATDTEPAAIATIGLCTGAAVGVEYTCERSSINTGFSQANDALLPAGSPFPADVVLIRTGVAGHEGVDPATLPTPAVTIRLDSQYVSAVEHDVSGVTADGRSIVSGPTLGYNNGAPDLFAVAAADVATPSVVEEFSSYGPYTHLFESLASQPAGTPAAPLPAPWVRPGPDATGIDNMLTTFFPSGSHRFGGTSAAAPTVAAIAALLVEARPDATPEQIYSALRASAIPVTPPDGVTAENSVGVGLVQAPAALAALGVQPLPGPGPGPGAAELPATGSADGAPAALGALVLGVLGALALIVVRSDRRSRRKWGVR